MPELRQYREIMEAVRRQVQVKVSDQSDPPGTELGTDGLLQALQSLSI